MTIAKKFRNELKYYADAHDLFIIEEKVKRVLDIDKYVNPTKGYYIVSSLYFDDYEDDCYHSNEFSLGLRKKYRIRMYNRDSNVLILEKKEKKNNRSHKTQYRLTQEEYFQIFYGDVGALHWQTEAPLLKEFTLEIMLRLFRPKVIVHYERTPYLYYSGNVRVTLDKNIATSSEIDRFIDGSYSTIPVLETGSHLVEMKYDEFLPEHIKQIVQTDSLEQATFSKYYIARKKARNFGGI